MTFDVYARRFNAELDDILPICYETASTGAGLSWVCPDYGPEGGNETAGKVMTRTTTPRWHVGPRVLTCADNSFGGAGAPLLS